MTSACAAMAPPKPLPITIASHVTTPSTGRERARPGGLEFARLRTAPFPNAETARGLAQTRETHGCHVYLRTCLTGLGTARMVGARATKGRAPTIVRQRAGRRTFMMTHDGSRSEAPSPSPDVTQLLLGWSGGDRAAGDGLMAAVYDELHRQAARAMGRETPEHTRQATGRVSGAYPRLSGQRRAQWRNRAHFFCVAGQPQRRIPGDHAGAPPCWAWPPSPSVAFSRTTRAPARRPSAAAGCASSRSVTSTRPGTCLTSRASTCSC